MKTYINIVLVLCVSVIFTSCTLDLQDNFEFKQDLDTTDPHDTKTAWEFIQERTELTEEDTTYSFEELNYMIAAIKKAGFEDLYDQTATADRTYLLLNNAAFLRSGNNIVNIVTGSPVVGPDETAEEVMERVDTPEKLETLRTLLKYHIVDAYVAQVPTLFETEVRYVFQTLIPGNDGLIVFSRNSRWSIQVNTAPAPLPATATSRPENVRRHNYVFNNGIGHFIHDLVQNKPYN
jgi:hypothetical protein